MNSRKRSFSWPVANTSVHASGEGQDRSKREISSGELWLHLAPVVEVASSALHACVHIVAPLIHFRPAPEMLNSCATARATHHRAISLEERHLEPRLVQMLLDRKQPILIGGEPMISLTARATHLHL